jgi:cysteine desulfurase
MMSTIYLDYAAATPLDSTVLSAMQPYFADHFYNPSATYLAAKATAKDIEGARARIAGWLGARPSELVFTAGGTEANNLAIHGVMSNHQDGTLLVGRVEHESVLEPARQHQHQEVAVMTDGRIDLTALEKMLTDQVVMVSIMYANNEIGTVQPLRLIADILQTVRRDRHRRGVKTPLYFHTDACQAGAYLDLHVSRLGVDLMTLNGGKIYGPKQSGVLYVKTGTILGSHIQGGGQEHGLRSGTENVAGIMGLAAALDLVQSRRREEVLRIQGLSARFTEELTKSLPNSRVNGSTKHRLPNNVHVTFPGQDNERLMMSLDEAGIQCALGSACSASSDEPSHVLRAIGMEEADIRSSLRFSLGYGTTEEELEQTVKTLQRLIA